MEQFRFLKWKVYGDAKEFFALVLRLSKKLPKEHRFELGSQAIRSAFSVTLNIAEGSGKESDKELNRYIEIALASVYETLAAADIFRDEGLIDEVDFSEVREKSAEIARQLGGLKKNLRK